MDPTFEPDLEGLQAVLAALPDFVLVLDRDGTISYINRLEEGFEMGSVLGTAARDLVRPESLDAHDVAVESAWKGGVPEEYEASIVAPTGDEEWYRSRVFPLRQEDRVIALLIVGTNVTELKAAQREIEEIRLLLPICSWCDRIQREDGGWESIEARLRREGGTSVTHGMCPDCLRKEIEEHPSDGDAA